MTLCQHQLTLPLDEVLRLALHHPLVQNLLHLISLALASAAVRHPDWFGGADLKKKRQNYNMTTTWSEDACQLPTYSDYSEAWVLGPPAAGRQPLSPIQPVGCAWPAWSWGWLAQEGGGSHVAGRQRRPHPLVCR